MRRPRKRSRSMVASSAQWMSSTTSTCSSSAALTCRSRALNSSSRGASAPHSSISWPPSCPAMSKRGPSGRGVNRPSQAPQHQVASGRRRCTCSARADLPTPASPAMSTSRPSPCRASAAYSPRAASCASRSSNGTTSLPRIPACRPPRITPPPGNRFSVGAEAPGQRPRHGYHQVVMGGGAGGGARVRLAELVAALSLGVDLGFGQPMEHVLRQCLIALRMAERVGLDEGDRVVVYYTALLVNVGCHSDAHEQAKWFGDDIALKGAKYEHDMHSLAYAATGIRMIGSGNPPLHRFRVGLEFALAGHRELDGMIARHAAIARSLADQLGLPDAVQQAVGASYEQWDGRGWPGELKGDAVPIAARLAQLAEDTEVAHRMGGAQAAAVL